MTAPTKLAAFAVLLLALGGGGAIAGGAIDPDRNEPAGDHTSKEPAGGHGASEADAHSDKSTDEGARGAEASAEGGHGAEAGAHPVRGVTVAENGLRLVVDDPELRRDRTENVRFRVVEDSGETVRDFDVEHTKRMHVIVVRRDFDGFQHLHPEQATDGSWSLPLKLEDAGSYRFFADFSHEKEKATLATDLRIDGKADLKPMPEATPAAFSDDGYHVELDAADVRRGKEAELSFKITKDGETVHTEPYLGAGGHLVALREGDMAFLHVHPTEHAEGEAEEAGHDDSIGFAATFPTEGKYRLFLQFQHEGRVQTVAFTQEVK